MREVLLCDIPIYPISKENYNKKVDSKREGLYNYFIERQNEDKFSREQSKRLMLPFVNWKYNEMIGYIEVSINKNDVVFNLYLSDIERYKYFSCKKHYINFVPTCGLHFYSGNKNDKEIKDEIKMYVEMIKNDVICRKSTYLDTTILKNIFEYVDIRKFIDDHNQN